MRLLIVAAIALLAAPTSGVAILNPPNDAGSGHDAPNQPVADIWIDPGTRYEGRFDNVLDGDHYAIRVAHAGPLAYWVETIYACAKLIAPEGQEFALTCSLEPGVPSYAWANVTPGTWFLSISGWAAADYAFSYGQDTPPAPPATPLQDDAGSGHDAPDVPTPMIHLESARAYNGTTSGAFDQDFYRLQADQGDRIAITATGAQSPCTHLVSIHGDNIPGPCSGMPPAEAVVLPGPGPWYLEVGSLGAGHYRFSVGINQPAASLQESPAEPATAFAFHPTPTQFEYVAARTLPANPRHDAGNDPTCGGLDEARQTSGTGGEAEPTLVWAALKTGSRAAVLWETTGPASAWLLYNVSGGDQQFLRETGPRNLHVFVIDDLPIGETLCFRTWDGARYGEPHALRLANAMNDYDPVERAYTINLLALSNEEATPTGHALIRDSFTAYAQIMRDATDGYVQAGRTILLAGNYMQHHSGLTTCATTTQAFDQPDTPSCNEIYDVVFTYEHRPLAEAAAYLDGIQKDDAAIYMNNRMFDKAVFEDPVGMGQVLVHEMGHYAFGAMDLYTLAGQGRTCFDPTTLISVMGNDGRAREFDDEFNRCPNEDLIELTAEYVPTWTNLRERFPEIPARTSAPATGPATAGAQYEYVEFRLFPDVVPEAPPPLNDVSAGALIDLPFDMAYCATFQQRCPDEVDSLSDDAGSGRDAGESRESAVDVELGQAYYGTSLAVDDQDLYSFFVDSAQTIHVTANWTTGALVSLIDPDGEIHEIPGTPFEASGSVAAAPGPWALLVHGVLHGAYGFAIALDEAPPAVAPHPALEEPGTLP